ncbi:ribosomal protection tetracycline resistance protein [Caldanaerobius fijiensis DSM 17918]|uniref:Ribosomal protection tetracycline resistance protein n=1 Tax=Caldanaerobius fijiensis DSM 17918 TaxID=1121256 RepID=A0A1M4Z1E5_9THEO|nr:TetM/TetW/TetO/TetS family tetracycline resistance ribosomal protection protein [Caldanaerobius fijiensis]SHF11893.1 ribosomal protection tetracycline resistance protein [Caldanaerobius fijiensis DSM 17918]
MPINDRLRNIGIVAHVDAGKTTTTEYMLYLSGKIRAIGSVDDGTAQTDYLEVERERGISVLAATTVFNWKGYTVNLIDTPGHIDFVSEVERSLRVLDGAILMISAVEGIQSYTEVLWNALKKMKIPTIFFINKMDRIGADADGLISEIKGMFTDRAFAVQHPIGRENQFRGVIDIFQENEISDDAIDTLSRVDDEVLKRYIDGQVLDNQYLKERTIELARRAEVFPILLGSAQKGIGITQLMDAIIDFLPAPRGDENRPLSAIVFKIQRDKTMGRLSYVRLYDGVMKNRDVVYNVTQGKEGKVAQIRKMHVNDYEDVGEVRAGDIAAVCGIDARVGDIIGCADAIPPEHKLAVPLLTVQVRPKNNNDYYKLVEALQELDEEDPTLEFQWHQAEKELHIKVMGTIQIEILYSILKDRFGIEVIFDEPMVIYKETPAKKGEGFVAYTMPKPCWAVLRFAIEPGERGSGLVYKSIVSTDKIRKRYQNDVERTLPEALKQGLYGWEVTDLKVTLIDGEDHVMHTHPQDFVVATPMAIMDGLVNTGVKLLEPILYFKIITPEEFAGKVLNDLAQMRAVFNSPWISRGMATIEGEIPLATSMNYPAHLSSATKGRSNMTTRFLQYKECPEGFVIERKRIGVNPLDRSKYILSVRGAL